MALGARPSRVMRSVLGEVLILTGIGLAAAALLAGFLPARRAARMDPMNALREE